MTVALRRWRRWRMRRAFNHAHASTGLRGTFRPSQAYCEGGYESERPGDCGCV